MQRNEQVAREYWQQIIMASKASDKNQFLCDFDSLENLETRSFEVKIKRKTIPLFIIRKDDQVFAYQNRCPHAQAPLEWNPHEFLDETKEHLICAMHGATFSIESGECLGGPCSGQGLISIATRVVDGDVVLI